MVYSEEGGNEPPFFNKEDKSLQMMHDIGKYHPLFQNKEPEMDECLRAKQLAYPVTDGYRHETGSKLAAIRIWRSEKRFDSVQNIGNVPVNTNCPAFDSFRTDRLT